MAGLLLAWRRLLRFRFVANDLRSLPHKMTSPGLYVFWHEMLLVTASAYGDLICPLISRSSDGDVAAEAIRRIGGEAVRGSTNHGGKDRGGASAMLKMLRMGKIRHMGIAVDGPIGPRRIVSPGAPLLSKLNNMPIVPVGAALGLSQAMGKENQMIRVPVPFCRCWIVMGAAIEPPARANRHEYRQIVQDALDAVQAQAESYALGGSGPKALDLPHIRQV